jgi:hypothetical protein
MRHRHTTTAAVAAGLLLLTACGGDSDDKADRLEKPAASTPATVGPTKAPPAIARTTGPIPTKAVDGPVGKPDTATQARYITALNAIDPAIVNGKDDRAVSRGRDQCSSVKTTPNDESALINLTIQRFTMPTQPLTATKAAQVLTAVRQYICPQY